MYNNQYYQNQSSNISSQEQPSIQKKVKKKKKKHIGLWIFLSILVLIGSFIGIKVWQNNVATEYLENLISNQPFTFNGYDYADYVTQNIEIPKEISVDENDTINIDWETSDENLISTDGIVTRPQSQSQKVTLTAIYKKGLGTGKKEFELNVIKTDTIKVEDIYVLTQEELDKGIGKSNIDITYDEDGNVATIDGNLNLTQVETTEDISVFINAYSDFLNIENIDFKVEEISSTLTGRKFNCIQMHNDIPVDGRNITIRTSPDGYVNSVTINVERNLGEIHSNSLSEATLLEVAKSQLGEDTEIYAYKKIIFNATEKDALVYDLTIYNTNTGDFKTIIIDAMTKEVLHQRNLYSKATESVKSTGKDVYGKNQTFYINKETAFLSTSYRFEDLKRNIRIVDGSSLWTVLKANKATVENPFSYIMDNKNLEISNNKNDFNDYPSGISAYKNFVNIYDFYFNNFGRKSFDGKGMPIGCLINFEGAKNNAAFISGEFQMFTVGDTDKFDYPLSAEIDVLGHEFTHGVFYYETGKPSYTGFEFDSINEAYADVMGCLIDGDWEFGKGIVAKNTVLRDPTFESECAYYDADKVKYPREYKGENWNTEDSHINSVVLSHVAYRMSQSGFSAQEIGKIWYNSLNYGLSTQATFIDVRHNVERSAKDLGYTEEKIELIGTLFDEVKIKEKEKFVIKNYSVDGDLLKDDTTKTDFLIVMSPIGTLFGSPISIFQVDNSVDGRYTDEEISSLMSEYLTTLLNEDTDEDLNIKINVEYHKLPQWAMDIVKNFSDTARQDLLTAFSEGSGMSTEEASGWLNFAFMVQHFEGTPYDFWTECFGVDFSQITFEKEN